MLTRVGAMAAVGALAFAGCATSGVDQGDWPAPEGSPPRVPDHGVLIGTAVPRTLPADGPQAAGFIGFDAALGTTTEIAHLFRTWSEPLVPPDLATIAGDGKYPLLSWNGSDIAGIDAGRYDELIRSQAESLAASGVPTLLRFRWEMDRPNLRQAMGSPQAFVSAWRRVHAIFESVGTPAVSWVWCPTAAGFQDGGDAAAFYPGDDVVDWLCADAYPDRELQPLSDLMSGFMRWAGTHDKPVMIGEFGVPRTADDDTRAAWLDRAATWLGTQRQVRAVVYFDLDVEATAPVLQFALDPGSASARAFDRMDHSLSEAAS